MYGSLIDPTLVFSGMQCFGQIKNSLFVHSCMWRHLLIAVSSCNQILSVILSVSSVSPIAALLISGHSTCVKCVRNSSIVGFVDSTHFNSRMSRNRSSSELVMNWFLCDVIYCDNYLLEDECTGM